MENFNFSSDIHTTLRKLIKIKSQRDGKEFTITQLAKAINMPHSMLVKLAHHVPSKRVVNPRIDTLSKIVEFFKNDGFSITIDDFVFGKNEIDINSISIDTEMEKRNVELYSLNNKFKIIGNADVMVQKTTDEIIAFISEVEIKPFFKAGSIFLINTNHPVEEENLVALTTSDAPKIKINKIIVKNKTKFICSLTGQEEIKFLPVLHHIIGVVVQVNAKT